MLRTSSNHLQTILDRLERATLDHAEWRDRVLRVVSRREAVEPGDLADDPHRHCLFGRWYFEEAPPELRNLASFRMIGAEHETQHRIATRMLRGLAAELPVEAAIIEDFEEASARLGYALYFIRREVECVLQSRDTSTDAHSSGEMLRDLREWHALAGQPGRQCCIALMQLDDVEAIDAAHGASVAAQALVTAVRVVATHLRLSDKVFRYDASRFLLRLSRTDLVPARKVVLRLREAVAAGFTSAGADGVPLQVTASFGIAMLDPAVDALESIDRADQALTLARSAGGNRIITWDPSVTTGVRLRRLEVRDVGE